MPPDPSAEFGSVDCCEIQQTIRHGAQKPIRCKAEDGHLYVVKPFSTAGAWPQVLEWMCARLGRAFGLPIPNYRVVMINEELAEAWNATQHRQIEPGPGFGSQWVERASECDESILAAVDPNFARRLLAFDWWIRNRDRIARNPNLLWSFATRQIFVIDHDQAGQSDGGDLFWSTHIFASTNVAGAWPPPDLQPELVALLPLLPVIRSELPSPWTRGPNGLDWFVQQLEESLQTTHRTWRTYE
jgi:hypothetical protein